MKLYLLSLFTCSKMKKLLFLILLLFSSLQSEKYKVFVAEKFEVNLNSKNKTFEVYRMNDKNIPVPRDTAFMSLKTALFAKKISNPLWQEELEKDTTIAKQVHNIVSTYIVLDVLSAGKETIKYPTDLEEIITEALKAKVTKAQEDFKDFSDVLSFISNLDKAVQEPLYRLSAYILSDPCLYFWKEACNIANGFLDQLKYVKSLKDYNDVVSYNNAVFIPKYLAELRAKLRPLPDLLKSLRKELNISDADIEKTYTIIKSNDSKKLIELRKEALDKVKKTESYEEYEKQVEKILLEMKKNKENLSYWTYMK